VPSSASLKTLFGRQLKLHKTASWPRRWANSTSSSGVIDWPPSAASPIL